MRFLQKLRIRKLVKKHMNRPLNINEILSRKDSTNVVVDAYEYFMRQSGWIIDGSFNEKIRVFLLCVLFDGEVANGGISQFLTADSGDRAYETVSALHTIGATEAVTLLKSSIELFPAGMVPENREERSNLMNQIDKEALAELDYKAWNCHSIHDLCYRYLMENKTSFCL